MTASRSVALRVAALFCVIGVAGGCGASTHGTAAGTASDDAGTPGDTSPGRDAGGSGGPQGGDDAAGSADGVADGVASSPPVDDAGSSGCGTGNVTTGSQSAQMTVNGTARTYVLSVPTNYAASTPQPLVFGYQGVGGSGKESQSTYGLEAPLSGSGGSATNTRGIFVYPDALVGSNTQDPTNSDYDYSPTGIDFAFFDALVKTLSATYCIDSKRIFATGISAGGIFSNMLGCYRGGTLRAIAPLSSEKPWSYTGGTVECTGHVAVWIAHGENDPYSSFTANGIPARDFWVAQDACSTTTVTDPTTPNACVDYQGCMPGFPVIWCVHDEGHNWPSTSPYICQDAGICFNAGPAIWSFFSSF